MATTDYNFSIIKTLRNARGKTLEALSKDTGLSVRTISDIELNKAVPSVSSLMALSESFGVSATDLYDIAQKTNPHIIKSERVTLKVTPDDPGNMIDLNNILFISKSYNEETVVTMEKPASFHYPCYEILYVFAGKAIVTVEGTEYTVEPQQCLHYASNLDHKFKFDANTDIIIFYMPRDNQIAKELTNANHYFNFRSKPNK